MLIKLFAIRNLETSRLAQYGKPEDIRRYVNDIQRDSQGNEENNLDTQFEDVPDVK